VLITEKTSNLLIFDLSNFVIKKGMLTHLFMLLVVISSISIKKESIISFSSICLILSVLSFRDVPTGQVKR
jgi:hypothetical protein